MTAQPKNQTDVSTQETADPAPAGPSEPAKPAKTTTAVRHRLPKRKVNSAWKTLSPTSCDLIQDSLSRAMKESRMDYPSLRRIESLTRKLTSKMRVPVGVFTGLKSDETGSVEMISLEALKKRNQDLERLIEHRQRSIAKLQQKLND